MKKQFQLLAVAAAVLLNSCTKEKITGTGNRISQQRNVSGFTEVKMMGANKVTIQQGNTFSLSITGYGNLLPHYESTVDGEVLELKYRDNSTVRNDNIEVEITMPTLTGVAVYGSGHINCSGNFKDNSSLEATISGSGNITLEQGNAQHLTGNISGSGNLYAFGFLTVNANINITGSGDAEIAVSNQLKAILSGSGNVHYKGSPAIEAQVNGSGKLIKRS